MVRWLVYEAVRRYILIKWYFLGDYYSRLGVQAQYLYSQSSLFRERWQLMGLDFAEQTFKNDSAHFFEKAKKEHIWIRTRIFLDSILGRPPQPYVMRNDSIL